MTRCEMCGYHWADLDYDGRQLGPAYCHYEGPAEWAPCEQENDYVPDDYYGDEEVEDYING